MIRRTKKKRIRKLAKTREIQHNTALKKSKNYNHESRRIEFKAPLNFSFVENTVETIEFFNNIISFITIPRNFGKKLYVDISSIQNLTIDALMYLLAIINNMNENFRDRFEISGNVPREPKIRRLIEESGFYSFVRYNGAQIEKNANTVQIVSGQNSANDVAKRVCDFVIEKGSLDEKNCRFLYVMLIELMANTFKHAYNSSNLLYPQWYCFAKYNKEENSIAFTFMDTGEGIPSTVRKNFAEKLDVLKLKGEQKYVISALCGDFRTSTLELYRGKGLPKIREFCSENKIQDMRIITNRADVSVQQKGYLAHELSQALKGTLYYWKIKLPL